MSLVERTIRTLFVLNGFGILLYLETMLKVQVEIKSWLSCGLLAAAWASLLWFLHRESQLPASPASIVGHAVWVLSALGYIWLGDDPLISFVPATGYDSSEPVPPMLAGVERTKLILTSIYYLLSTTGMAWLLRLVTGKRTDSSQAQSSDRMNGQYLRDADLLCNLKCRRSLLHGWFCCSWLCRSNGTHITRMVACRNRGCKREQDGFPRWNCRTIVLHAHQLHVIQPRSNRASGKVMMRRHPEEKIDGGNHRSADHLLHASEGRAGVRPAPLQRLQVPAQATSGSRAGVTGRTAGLLA